MPPKRNKPSGKEKDTASVAKKGKKPVARNLEGELLGTPLSTKRGGDDSSDEEFGFIQTPEKTIVKTEPGSTGSAYSTNGTKLLDQMFLAKVYGPKPDHGGIFVYFLPNEAKYGNTGPFSSKVLDDTIQKSDLKLCGLAFAKIPFNLVLNGKKMMWPIKKNFQERPGKVFMALDIQGFDKISDDTWRKFCEKVISKMTDYMATIASWGTGPSAEIAKNFISGNRENVVADYVGIEKAFDILKFNYTFPLQPETNPIPRVEKEDYAETNMNIVKTFFKKGTLDINTCVQLGLAEDWLTRAARGESDDDLDTNEASTLDLDA